jgi:hypothetical protein
MPGAGTTVAPMTTTTEPSRLVYVTQGTASVSDAAVIEGRGVGRSRVEARTTSSGANTTRQVELITSTRFAEWLASMRAGPS